MHKVRRFDITENKITRFLREGRGQGTGKDYKPWLTVRDLSSQGRSSRVYSALCQRHHELFSDIERSGLQYYLKEPGVVDIREQFPLDRKTTRKIAKKLGIPHPCHKGVEPYMTTDLLVFIQVGKVVKKVAVYVKPKEKLDDERTFEKMLIELVYWEDKGVDFVVFTEEEVQKVVSDNILWLSQAEPVEADFETLCIRSKTYQKLLEQHKNLKVTDLCKSLDQRYQQYRGEAYNEVKELIASGLFQIDFQKDFRDLRCGDVRAIQPLENNAA